jgi:RNA polymerase sigma factor (sigma-70 family)
MQDWTELVAGARDGDLAAFDNLVGRFRDMAVGYAYSILKDFHLSEDVAQEAFVRAYSDLHTLAKPKAFPAWLRRIVYKYCDRHMRKQRVILEPLEAWPDLASAADDPHQATVRRETHDEILAGINSLPGRERVTTTLFYINGYSMAEVGEFLEVPVTTVKNHLYQARKKLKARLMAMVGETLKQHAPGDDFNVRVRRVLEGVPQVSFELYKLYRSDGMQRCPESMPFVSCLRSCLEFMGEDWGYKAIEAHGTKWRLDNGYVYLMGTTGAAFRLNWKPGWHMDNPAISLMADDRMEPFRRGFDSVGYAYEFIEREHEGKGEAHFRKRIIESIRDGRRPVIARGVVGPPVECIIVGYDDDGAALIGWSYFQGLPEFSAGLEFEPSGYFRKRDWFKHTAGLFLIGDKTEAPPRGEAYRSALAWALDIARTPVVLDDRHNGHAAYAAWADALSDDDEFPAGDMDLLRFRYHVHEDAVGTVAEGRWYAAQFLKQVVEDEPALGEHLQAAIRCYEAEHDLMWKIWGLVGGPERSDAGAQKLAEAETRRQIIPTIREAQDKDRQAIGHIEKALD